MAEKNDSEQDSSDASENEPDIQAVEKESPLEPIRSELEDATSTSSHYEIVSIPADFTLEGLVTKWKKKQLTIPGYQRKFVWTQRQASRLIESFLLGLPVPVIIRPAASSAGN